VAHVVTGDDARVNVRYIVDDVDAAVDFYTTHLGFELISSWGPETSAFC